MAPTRLQVPADGGKAYYLDADAPTPTPTLFYSAILAFDAFQVLVHRFVIEYLSSDDTLATLLTIVIVAAIVSTVVFVFTFPILLFLTRSVKRCGRPTGPFDVLVKFSGNGEGDGEAPLVSVTINPAAVKTLEDLKRVLIGGAARTDASTKVARVILLPQTLLINDAGLKALRPGSHLEVDLKR